MGILGYELRAALAQPGMYINPIAFALLIVTLFGLVLPDDLLRASGGPILWVTVLLTTVLSLDGAFRRAFDNGVLEQLLMEAEVPFLAILAKLLVHWCFGGLLITLLSPLLGYLLGIPGESLGVLALALLLGTPALTLLGGMGAGLTVGLSRGGVLMALLLLPLYVPVLIFGTAVVVEHGVGASVLSQMYMLALISMVALTIGPFATLAGLKISIQLQ